MHIYVRVDTITLLIGIRPVILTKKRKQHPSPGDDASTADVAPGRVGRGEQDEARRANETPNGGPHLELGRLWLKTWFQSDSSIAYTTGQHICTKQNTRYLLRVIPA